MLVQDTWRPIQERFFEEAERAAEAADKMPLAEANSMLGDSHEILYRTHSRLIGSDRVPQRFSCDDLRVL